MPLSIALLRRVVAAPNTTPATRTRRSWPVVDVPDEGRLLAKSRQPKKDSRAQELSAKGAERKRPAGERMWRMPEVRANPELAEVGKMATVKANSVNIESRWAVWAISMATRLSKPW